MRNRRFIAQFTSIHFAISATPSSQCTLYTAVTSVAEVCEILKFCFCGSVFRTFLSICQLSSVTGCNGWRAATDDDFKFRHSLLTMAAVSSPFAALSCPSTLSAIQTSQATELTRNIIHPRDSPRHLTELLPWGPHLPDMIWVVPRADDKRQEREVLRVSCVSWLGRTGKGIDADGCAVDGELRAAVLWGDVGCPRGCSRVTRWHCCNYRAPAERQKSSSHIFVKKTKLDYSAHLH